MLRRFGNMEKVQVVLDGHSGRSRGFAFIYYSNVDDAAEVNAPNEHIFYFYVSWFRNIFIISM